MRVLMITFHLYPFIASTFYHLILAVPTPEVVLPTQSLYYSHSIHDEDHRNFNGGVFAGEFDPTTNGRNRNLTQHQLECFQSVPFFIRQDRLLTQGLSYDEDYDRLLLHLFHTEGRISVFMVQRCFHHRMCDDDIVEQNEFYRGKTLFSYGLTTDSEDEYCTTTLKPFGIYNYQTYFVAVRVISAKQMYSNIPFATPIVESNRTMAMRIELRRMARCNFKMFHSIYPYSIDECSQLVSLIEENDPELCSFRNLGNHLYIGKDVDGKTIFVTQLFNRSSSLFEAVLLMMRSGEKARELYRVGLPYEYHKITDRGQHIGGIHYKDGKICWSALIYIYCATWDGVGNLKDVERMLRPGESSKAGICPEDPNEESYMSRMLSNITTGLVITEVDVNRGITLIFGCEQQSGKGGGAGMLRMLPDTGSAVLFPVSDDGGKIKAGSMFMAETCPPVQDSGQGIITNNPMHLAFIILLMIWLNK